MAPTEEHILSTFLLPPSPLPSIITLKSFTELFPKSRQASPQIRALYRDLQYQRAKVVDNVARSIAIEVKRGKAQRRVVVGTRRQGEQEEQDDEVDIENALFGLTSNLDSSKPHSLSSILPSMERAASDIEDEIRRLEEEADSLLEGIQGTVGGLSDIRYGRLSNTKLAEQVLDGLHRLGSSCNLT